MILPDLNLLLYAYNPHVAQHQKAASWWQETVAGDELIGLPYEICFSFARIANHFGLAIDLTEKPMGSTTLISDAILAA